MLGVHRVLYSALRTFCLTASKAAAQRLLERTEPAVSASGFLQHSSFLTLQGRQLVQADGDGGVKTQESEAMKDNYTNIGPISGHFYSCDDIRTVITTMASSLLLRSAPQRSSSANSPRPLAPALISIFTESY